MSLREKGDENLDFSIVRHALHVSLKYVVVSRFRTEMRKASRGKNEEDRSTRYLRESFAERSVAVGTKQENPDAYARYVKLDSAILWRINMH